jgi:hypothetical protein
MKLVALNGLLGYGYSQTSLVNAFMDPPDFVGVDGGSSDPGPYYLGSGESFTNRSAVKRDLALVLPLALEAGAPLIVGTAGGSGSRVHLHWLRDIVYEIARESGLSFKMALIYTDVDNEYVLNKLDAGRILPLGPLELTREKAAQANRIVSQIGAEPFMEALKAGAQVVLAGRACDTAIYAAPCLLHGYDPGLAFHMAKIMECGAMCATPVAAADVMQAEIQQDCFRLTPANPNRRCLVAGVAAHSMYEQADPRYLVEPDGTVDLTGCRFTQVDERTVQVQGSKWIPAQTPTLKLEGTQLSGYRTISIAGIQDPKTIEKVDWIFEGVQKFVAENTAGRYTCDDYTLTLRKYGTPIPGAPVLPEPNCSLGIVLDAVGKTQAIADEIMALARARMLHFDYPGRKSTAGNLAFPYSPSDIHLGPVYTFCIYHIAQVDSLTETAKIVTEQVGGAQ